ncbi:hypothetical protein [Idiomarina abyssalis]|uniref:Uncharacterized protein n=1 Tax=Idiomarina abyssalis TaxID=86102 RepID=A0A8I1KFF1_9GAMM|nr:hypothetical protein [Idiomarina abyssalis]MBJ7265420.1 hypothetical protein [Idiomarina abyssalis]MBJ7316906.1 hypothetical protein [Idiomarina abyssalis]
MNKQFLGILAIIGIIGWLEFGVFQFFIPTEFKLLVTLSPLLLMPAVIFAVGFLAGLIQTRIEKSPVIISVEHNSLFARMKGGEQYRIDGNFSNDLSIINSDQEFLSAVHKSFKMFDESGHIKLAPYVVVIGMEKLSEPERRMMQKLILEAGASHVAMANTGADIDSVMSEQKPATFFK